MKKNQKIVLPVYVDGKRMTAEDIAYLEISPSRVTWSRGYVSRKSKLSDLGVQFNKQLKQFFYYFPSWRSTLFCHRVAFDKKVFAEKFSVKITEFAVNLKTRQNIP